MPEGLNKVILIGNLGQNPELRHTQSGTAILNLRIATNETWVQDGEKKERTEWHTVIVWGKRGEALAGFLDKGHSICVEGRLQTRSWEDKSTGAKRYATEIVASNIVLLGGGGGASGGGGKRTTKRKDDGFGAPPDNGGAGFGDDDIPF